jgi:hypothetical protein
VHWQPRAAVKLPIVAAEELQILIALLLDLSGLYVAVE